MAGILLDRCATIKAHGYSGIGIHDADGNRLDDEQIKEDFNELYRLMNGMERREMDKIIYLVCTLCRDHEQTGFIGEIKIGVLLQAELTAE